MEPPEVKFLVDGETRDAKITWRQSTRQIVACLVTCCLGLQIGVNMSFSAILLPQLAEKSSPITISPDQASWIASVVAISLPIGSFIIGPLMDAYGRKTLCVVNAIPFTVAWLFQIFATKVWHIYLARIIQGISGGLSTVVIVYVAETSHPSMRQLLLTMNSVYVSLGILLTYFFGILIRWQATAILFCAISAITGVAILFLPESPYWLLVFKKDYQAAQKALRWIYRDEKIYESQYRQLVEVNGPQDEKKRPLMEKIKLQVECYKDPRVYKPAIVLASVFFFQQMCGAYVIIFYATDLYRKIGGGSEKMDEFAALVLIGLIRFVVSIASAAIAKSVGRRVLLCASGLGMSFCSFCAGLYIYLTMQPYTGGGRTDNIAFFFLLGYVTFGSMGFLVIPWTLIGELLPVKVRGTLGGALIAFAYLFMFLLVKVFPDLLATMDIHCLFYVLTIINLFSVFFIYFFLPETLGKTFAEIERYFADKK